MTSDKKSILGWLIPGLAAVAVAGALLAWQWPRIIGPSENAGPAPVELGALRPADRASTADHVRVSAQRQGRELVTTLIIEDHWHVNATPASLDFLIPTTVTATANGEVLALTVTYPEGHTIDVGLEKPIAVYSGGTEIQTELPDVADIAPIEVTVRAQACNDAGRCLPPSTLRAPVVRNAVNSDAS